MDLAGTEGSTSDEPLAATAQRMRDTVAEQTELTVSIGGGTTKLVAKLAVERAKPKPGTGATGVHIVARRRAKVDFSRPSISLKSRCIGPRFQERLAKLGMRTSARRAAVRPPDADAVARRRAKRSGCSTACAASTTARSKPTATRRASAATRRSRADIDDDDELRASCSRS